MEEVKAWQGYYCSVGRQGSIPQHRTLNLRTEGQLGVSQAQGISVGKEVWKQKFLREKKEQIKPQS